jgi:minimal PKS acyl carrier protein
MRQITHDELMALLQECAGVDEAVATDDEDAPFEAMGYDSLALLEVAGRLEQQMGVSLPDDLVAELKTPRQFRDAVNGLTAEAS